MDASSTEILEVGVAAAQAGADVLMNHLGSVTPEEKGRNDFVTQADLASQHAIRQVIETRFPSHYFVGEEGEHQASIAGPHVWIVDPLDGTTNFLHGLPYFAVSVAMAHHGRVEAGVVINPVSGECFAAARGRGATLNGTPISVSNTSRLTDALVAFSLPPRVSQDSKELSMLGQVAPHCRAVRRLGAAALNLCFVAAGRLDAYWATELHSWDLAAGSLIIEEAGGVVSSGPSPGISLESPKILAAATPSLWTEVVEQLGSKFASG